MTYHVDPAKAALLNLREGPKPAAIIVALSQGTLVTKLGEYVSQPDWWQVTAHLDGNDVDGFVKASFLAPGTPVATPPVVLPEIPEVHLRNNDNKRSQDYGRAFPLDEVGMPSRNNGTDAQKASDLLKIIEYLDPGKNSHKRYKASGGKTFCNIYAYDYASVSGVYLPRVWWKETAIISIANGSVPPVNYGNTVRELNANSLHDWFEEFGVVFGWKRVFSIADLQGAANAGEVAIMVAKRANVARSGHIVAVIPEHNGFKAAVSDGKIVRPVESQAGSANFKAKVKTKRWWQNSKFQSFGFWVHA